MNPAAFINAERLSEWLPGLRRLALATAAAAYSACGTWVAAAPLSISDTPLFLSPGVQPNLIMAIDDSGSMDSELLLSTNDGAAWWRTAATGSCTNAAAPANSFVGCVSNGSGNLAGAGRLNFNHSGDYDATWKKFIYLFPNGADTGSNATDRRRSQDNANAHFAVPPLPEYAWARSPDHNAAYFDPSETYLPWPDGGGYTFGNSTPTAARFDPVYSGYGSINLTQDIAGGGNTATATACTTAALPANAANMYFRVYTGMTIPAGACIRRSGTATGWSTTDWALVRTGGCVVGTTNGCLVTVNGTNGQRTLASDSAVAIRYFPATVFLGAASGGIAGYVASPLNTGRAPDGSTLYGYEIKPGNFATTAEYNAAIQNFANWFTYYRKRHQGLRAGLGRAFDTITGMRIAGFRINQSASPGSPDVTMRTLDADRTGLYQDFYRNWTGAGSSGTPNRAAVANIIRNFRRTGANAPIIASCQRNFGMLFTDGFSNAPSSGDNLSAASGNVDGQFDPPRRGVAPYSDGVSNTMADHTMYGYVTPLRTDLEAGRVSPALACSDVNPPGSADCNTNLHMNFYAVTLGARGLQFDPDAPVDPYVATPTWPTTFPNRHPNAVDDLWHATINGRGQLLNARRSSELADKLGSVLRSIIETEGSASSASVNSGTIQSDTRLFQASFGSKNWSGDLRAYPITANGSLGAAVSATFAVPDSRNIVTVNTNGNAVPFRWASIDATRQGQLQPLDARGALRLNYLRGDRSNELPVANGFRRRDSVLGDIVNSAPVFVGVPPFRYPDNIAPQPYSSFVLANTSRRHMVYAGANDGMLHAFEVGATSVTERFAFIPGAVFRNLHHLSDPAYTHRYYVDGTVSAVDAFVGGQWRTTLVAGLNKGGQGVYALDVTNPNNLTEANAANVLMWEFTDEDDADLGYTYSRPAVVRMHNGKWAAVFGNGYNNTEADGRVSATGQAALFILDMEDGSVLRKIVVPTDPAAAGRPNGLATPAVIDLDGDGVVDYAYAGDLFGNMWKFDLRANAASSWDVAIKAGGVSRPLYTARGPLGNVQPITSRPQVGPGPNGVGMVVLWGTGKFIETTDRNPGSLGTQTFYGIFDSNTGTPTDAVNTWGAGGRGMLQEQEILDEVVADFVGPSGENISSLVRLTSNNTVDPPPTQRGWFMDLLSPGSGNEGEMQVTDPVLRNGRVIFTTLIPDTDPCRSGGRSWLMDIDALSGSRLTYTPFDLDNNKLFNEQDFVTVTINGESVTVPASGFAGDAIFSRAAIISGGDTEYSFVTDTEGRITTTRVNPGPGGTGRQSWRQLR